MWDNLLLITLINYQLVYLYSRLLYKYKYEMFDIIHFNSKEKNKTVDPIKIK